MKRLLEFVDSALGVVLARVPAARAGNGTENSIDVVRDALIDRLSLADAAARRWLQAEELDLKNVSRLCRLAKLASQSIARCRMISAGGSTAFDDVERISEELAGAGDRVEAGPTPAGVTALSQLLQRSVRGLVERLERAGIQSAQFVQELNDVLVQAKELEAGFPRPAPIVGLTAACKKARALLGRDIAGVQPGSELDLDLALAALIAGGLVDGTIEPVRHAYFFVIALIKGACLGGAEVSGAEAVQRLSAIASCFDSFNLSCDAFFYLNAPAEQEGEASESVVDPLVGGVAAQPQTEIEIPAPSPIGDTIVEASRPPVAVAQPTQLERNFLTVVAGASETDDLLRKNAREILDGRRVWIGLEAFLTELERAQAPGFVRVGRALARLADA